MAIYSKSNTFAANTVISSTNVNQNFDEISTAINSTLTNGTSVKPTVGGTGLTSYTTGDTLYASASNVLSKLAIGTAGQTLQIVNGIPVWATVNAGAKNYVTYNNFENNATTGWGLGTMASSLTNGLPTSANTPTFGSGASVNLTLSSTSSSPLAGTYSLSLASSAATTVPNFVASDALSIDLEDRSKILAFKFYYNLTVNGLSAGGMGGTSANNFAISIYDVTNSAWIIPAGCFNFTQSSGVGICQGTFQTASNTASLRLVIYNATATSSATTILFDDFYVGPQSLAFGPAMSDWLAYTPTFTGFGTVSNASAYWRRDGGDLVVQGTVTTGTVAGSLASITLPTGLSVDTTRMSLANTSGNPGPQVGSYMGSGLAAANGALVLATTTNAALIYFGNLNTATSILTPQNGSTIAATANVVAYSFRIPVSGWSVNSIMSADTDTRVCAAIISGDPASATSGNPIIVPTVGYDSHSSYSASTGRYTCPITGIYKMFGSLQSASSATTLTIYKNAVSTALAGNLDSNGEATYCGAVSCVAGDLIDLRPGGTVDATAMTLNIERLSGPVAVASSEGVNARYYASGTSISGSAAVIVWTTKDYDTHNAMSSGVYTVPVTGKYQVNASIATSGTFSTNVETIFSLQKNSVDVSVRDNFAGGAITNSVDTLSDTISCVAGDTIRMRLLSGATGPAIVSSNIKNWISIARVGN